MLITVRSAKLLCMYDTQGRTAKQDTPSVATFRDLSHWGWQF